MAQDSKIEWTHHTANLWWGCTKVHEGCDNCYASTLSNRLGNDIWGNDKPRKLIKGVWNDLDKYQRLAQQAGEIHRVFVGSMMDIFEKPMPLIDSKGSIITDISTGDLRKTLFTAISNGEYPNLLFLLLTKRPSNINKYIPVAWRSKAPENVMFGTSPVNQETLGTLLTQLLDVRGRKFLSIEPQLDEIDFTKFRDNDLYHLECLSWIIQGGESGYNKRPFNTDWARKIKAQCEEASVPYFFKQIDKVQSIPDDLFIRQFPKSF